VVHDVEAWKESMKSYFMRQFMADNGILPELGDIISTNDHGHAKLDMETMMLNHIKALVETLGKSQVKLKVVGAANDKILNAAGIQPEGGAGGFGGGGFGGGGDFGAGGGFGAGGDDMGGFGGDAGMGADAAALGADAGAGAEGEMPPEDPNAATF
jgi:hypothetical protein